MARMIRVTDVNRVDHDILVYDEKTDIKYSKNNDGRYPLTMEDMIETEITKDMVEMYISDHNLDPDDVGFDEEEIGERYVENAEGYQIYESMKNYNKEGLVELLALIPNDMFMQEVGRRNGKSIEC